MFGLIIGFLHIGARICVGVQDCLNENKSKERCSAAGYDFYIDRKGCKRRLSNNEPFFERYDYKTGHVLEVNPYTGRSYRDITEDAIVRNEKKVKNDAVNAGKRYYRYSSNEINQTKRHINGHRFKNVDNSNTLFVRRRVGNSCLSGVPWFLNIETGLYEEPDRSCIKDDSCWTDLETGITYCYKSEKDINCLKTRLNELQAELINKYGINGSPVWHNDSAHVCNY